ncbi:hypothetical protein ACTJJ0_19860 [Chitinophaga sp. 22321]|uniref:Right handed beta helix region n=1 Tax=Chitinophaga hostae TaxID=2831022 RepID=A0ABS5IX43_9BACT|nr:hypothetical protein [Chitinophaga hostae]MBS0027506.1 hypothetical protein [Chitinophaga hostae]
MKKTFLFAAVLLFLLCRQLTAQTIFVDPLKGDDTQNGSADHPLASLEKAVATANSFPGTQPVTIKLGAGLYTLTDQLTILSPAGKQGMRYSMEAAILPDDSNWAPAKMPVIQSISANNSTVQFPHAVGIRVAIPLVSFRGLKFTGNANPAVTYYYPITKEDSLLQGLEVSQCLFVGDRYAAPIQGAVWAHGPSTVIDHCIFFNCKNALLFFKGVEHFSVTHSIIYGAYEAAMWVWLLNGQLTFRDNIVANCGYLWTIPKDADTKAVFENSLLIQVQHDAGNWVNGMTPANSRGFEFKNTGRTGKADLVEPASPVDPVEQLDLSALSKGHTTDAGLFKVRKTR